MNDCLTCAIGVGVLIMIIDIVLWIRSRGTLLVEDKQFGPSLKASPFFSSRNNVVMVLGIYKDKDQKTNSSTNVSRTKTPPMVDATVNCTPVGSSCHALPPCA